MNTHIVILACLCGALAYALPVSNSDQPQENIDLVQIPLNGDKELDILTLGESGQLTERNKRTIGILRQLFPELSKNGDNSIDMAALTEQLQETIRVARQAEAEQAAQQAAEQANPADNETGSNDQQVSESKAPAIDELTLDAEEPDVADDDRNKRFLSFSLGGSGGGAGGSGNFLFDIIRLFSGSVGTQQTDEKANAPISGEDTATIGGDGYTEGIPGPVTRLFVLANRGIANLIQDLILRIAQTSERIVNFKARLITSLI